MDDVMKKYVELINLEKSHIFKSPPIIFLCGGEVDIKKTTNHSIRNMFLVAQHMVQYRQTGIAAAPMPERVSAWAVYDVFATDRKSVV